MVDGPGRAVGIGVQAHQDVDVWGEERRERAIGPAGDRPGPVAEDGGHDRLEIGGIDEIEPEQVPARQTVGPGTWVLGVEPGRRSRRSRR